MIIPFEKLKNYDFELSDINVICQSPSYRQLNINNRIFNGFMYVKKGECEYLFKGDNFKMSAGALVYLPLSSFHTLRILSDEIEFYRINFTLKIRGEVVLFSDRPTKITDSVSTECADAIRSLDEDYLFENNTVAKVAKLCTVFSSLQRAEKAVSSKLWPAISFLHSHLTEHIDCRHLASLCFLSSAQFYNLFSSEFGTTPLQYKNRLLLERAASLFKSGGITVSEVSDMLGFESPAYFSRFFKKHMGFSPTGYIKKIEASL